MPCILWGRCPCYQQYLGNSTCGSCPDAVHMERRRGYPVLCRSIGRSSEAAGSVLCRDSRTCRCLVYLSAVQLSRNILNQPAAPFPGVPCLKPLADRRRCRCGHWCWQPSLEESGCRQPVPLPKSLASSRQSHKLTYRPLALACSSPTRHCNRYGGAAYKGEAA